MLMLKHTTQRQFTGLQVSINYSKHLIKLDGQEDMELKSGWGQGSDAALGSACLEAEGGGSGTETGAYRCTFTAHSAP